MGALAEGNSRPAPQRSPRAGSPRQRQPACQACRQGWRTRCEPWKHCWAMGATGLARPTR